MPGIAKNAMYLDNLNSEWVLRLSIYEHVDLAMEMQDTFQNKDDKFRWMSYMSVVSGSMTKGSILRLKEVPLLVKLHI